MRQVTRERDTYLETGKIQVVRDMRETGNQRQKQVWDR